MYVTKFEIVLTGYAGDLSYSLFGITNRDPYEEFQL